MKRLQLRDLRVSGTAHVAHALCPENYIFKGGLSFHRRGFRTHDGAEEKHPYHEVFVIMQGRGWIEIDGHRQPVSAGDVLLIEPGEDHHLVGDPEHPIINLWFDLGAEPHEAQRGP